MLIGRAVMQGSDAAVLSALGGQPSAADAIPDMSLVLEELYETELVSALRSGALGPDELALRAIRQRFVGEAEAKVISKVLDHTNWNRKKASTMLKVSYKSLLNKIKEYRLG